MIKFIKALGRRSTITWDVFVSHASEDKKRFAEPLTLSLRRAGFAVWLDKFALRSGDDFIQVIDQGVRASACGILIITPRYMEKAFTNYEIEQLLRHESAHGLRIIPLRSGVDLEAVTARYPALTSRLILDLDEGVDCVAGRIATDLLADPMLPAAQLKSLPRRLLEVLSDAGETAEETLPLRLGVSGFRRTSNAFRVAHFLQAHPEIISAAYGKTPEHCRIWSYLCPDQGVFSLAPDRRITPLTALDEWEIEQLSERAKLSDFEVSNFGTYTGSDHLIIFGSDQDILSDNSNDKLTLQAIVSKIATSKSDATLQRSQNQKFTLVFGRRAAKGSKKEVDIESFNRKYGYRGLTLRSHDWLLDVADAIWSRRGQPSA